MKNKVAKNYLFNLSYQALLAFVPLVTQPYISRILGAECLGEYSYTQSIVMYFILFGSLGVNVYGQREIAFVQDDKDKRSKIFMELFLLKIITIGISVCCFLCFVGNMHKYKLLFAIQTLDILATGIDITWFFQGMEEFKKIAIRNCIVKAAGVLFVFILVRKKTDLPMYIFIYSATLFIGNMTLWLYLPKYIRITKNINIDIIRHLKKTIWLFIPQIATSVYTILDKTMIGIIINSTTDIGVYDYVQKIINLFLTVITSMGTVMLPRVSSYYAIGDKYNLKLSIQNSINFVYLLAFPMILGIMVIADSFSYCFWGPNFIGAGSVMRILSTIILLAGMSNVTGIQYLVPTGKEKSFSFSIILGSITNFLLNIFLINELGAIGACISSVIAELIILLVQLYIIREDISVSKFVGKIHIYIISSIIMAAIIYNLQFSSIMIFNLILQVISGIVIYIVCLVIFKEPIMLKIINAIKVSSIKGFITK